MDFEARRRSMQQKLANAQRHLEENVSIVARRAKLIGQWQRKVRWYEAQLEKTADDLAAEKARVEERKATRKRARRHNTDRLIADPGEEV
jgi:hypothetical protein